MTQIEAQPTPEPEQPSALGRVSLALDDIKLAHSVFALPFAVLGAFLARPADSRWSRFGWQLTLIVLCMVFARTWAMLVNRVADARIDADNPRTARRAFAAGRLSMAEGYRFLAISAIGFVACCAVFGFAFDNWWPAILSVPVLIWIAFYSFTKRFTWLCHVFLGGALAASPIAAAIAIEPTSATAPAVLWLAGMVLLWVAGFDVIYALQDLDFDRSAGLNSIPARFGWRGSAWISRLLHAGAIACLVLAWHAEPRFGPLFGIAVGLVVACLILEHAVLARRGAAGIPMAFFTLNGVVSVALGLAGVVELVLG